MLPNRLARFALRWQFTRTLLQRHISDAGRDIDTLPLDAATTALQLKELYHVII